MPGHSPTGLGRIVAIIAASALGIIVLASLTYFALNALTDRTDPADVANQPMFRPTPTAPDGDKCSVDTVRLSPDAAYVDAVRYCEGDWLLGRSSDGQKGSLFHWLNGRWTAYPPQGTTPNNQQCYSGPALDSDQVPTGVRPQIVTCPQDQPVPEQTSQSPQPPANRYITSIQVGDAVVNASAPACDGRTILIVDSVIARPGTDVPRAIADSMRAHSGSAYTLPGQCPSLRAQYEGSDVYAIYRDYGQDKTAACTARRNLGGHARVLDSSGNYGDPCD